MLAFASSAPLRGYECDRCIFHTVSVGDAQHSTPIRGASANRNDTKGYPGIGTTPAPVPGSGPLRVSGYCGRSALPLSVTPLLHRSESVAAKPAVATSARGATETVRRRGRGRQRRSSSSRRQAGPQPGRQSILSSTTERLSVRLSPRQSLIPLQVMDAISAALSRRTMMVPFRSR
jgi:hypothetical protein